MNIYVTRSVYLPDTLGRSGPGGIEKCVLLIRYETARYLCRRTYFCWSPGLCDKQLLQFKEEATDLYRPPGTIELMLLDACHKVTRLRSMMGFSKPLWKTIYYRTCSLKTGLDLLTNSAISALQSFALAAKKVLLMDNVGNDSRLLQSSSARFCHKTPGMYLQNW